MRSARTPEGASHIVPRRPAPPSTVHRPPSTDQRAPRAAFARRAPHAAEIISYGIPAYKGKRILVVISPTKKGITFAFSRGADFEDQYGLLEGVGQVSKNVRMSDLKQVNKAALRYYIKQALAFDSR